jgi:hypothetical protein
MRTAPISTMRAFARIETGRLGIDDYCVERDQRRGAAA